MIWRRTAIRKMYLVRLTSEERAHLEAMVSKAKVAACRIKHANILLATDVEGPGWPDRRIAAAEIRERMNHDLPIPPATLDFGGLYEQ
jgi:hypothetical protein